VAANLDVIARTLGLRAVETAVLQFVITCTRRDMQELLDPIACNGSRGPAILIAAALAEPTDKVEAALDRKSRLITSGLVELLDGCDLDDRIQADKRLENLLFAPSLDATTFVDRFLPTAPAPTTTALSPARTRSIICRSAPSCSMPKGPWLRRSRTCGPGPKS